MTKPSPFKIKHVIICDDIRREDNGKHILLGVYSGAIVVGGFPVPLSPCFFVEGYAEEKGAVYNVTYKLVGNDDLDLMQGQFSFRVEQQDTTFYLPIKTIQQMFQVPMRVSLHIQQNGGDWENVASINIVKGDIHMIQPGALVQPPPVKSNEAAN